MSPADIAVPIRGVLRRQSHTEVWLGEAVEVDVERAIVQLSDGASVGYDYLVVATGATHAYFGHSEWAAVAPGLKTVEDALEMRRRFLLAFEAAEREPDPARQRRLLTFVIVGAGPTGVELAGAMSEIARTVMPQDFRAIDTTTTRILLLEGGPRVLPVYPAELSERAQAQLERLGVEVRVDAMVTAIEPDCVRVGEERIEAANVFWAAGVAASPLGASLGAPLDRAGRVRVEPDCSVPDRPDIFVVGDLARHDHDGFIVPGVAQGAIQMGRHAARCIAADLAGKPRKPFRYRNYGELATIGRAAAVAWFGRVRFSGFPAWFTWVFVHILKLIGFRNRLIVMIQWAWAWVAYTRGIRLITGPAEIGARPGTDTAGSGAQARSEAIDASETVR